MTYKWLLLCVLWKFVTLSLSLCQILSPIGPLEIKRKVKWMDGWMDGGQTTYIILSYLPIPGGRDKGIPIQQPFDSQYSILVSMSFNIINNNTNTNVIISQKDRFGGWKSIQMINKKVWESVWVSVCVWVYEWVCMSEWMSDMYKVWMFLPDLGSHSLSKLSLLPDTSIPLYGCQSTHFTSHPCPSNNHQKCDFGVIWLSCCFLNCSLGRQSLDVGNAVKLL